MGWAKMTLPEIAMLVGIFINLAVSVKIAYMSGQKVQQVEDHERRIGEVESKVEKQSGHISDAHRKIAVLEKTVEKIPRRIGD